MAYKYICPNCGHDIIVRFCKPGDKAICMTCRQPAVVPEDAAIYEAGAERCRVHPEIIATRRCANCGAALCETCSFQGEDNRILCADCASLPQAEAGGDVSAIAVPDGMMCASHPEVEAVAMCVSCGAGVCTTCDFAMPGDIHICPKCASRPPEGLDSKRRNKVIWAYVLAGIATFGMLFIILGSNIGLFENSPENGLGIIFSLVVFWPSLIGLILASISHEKRRHNPGFLVGAIVWNSAVLGLFLLMTIIGLML